MLIDTNIFLEVFLSQARAAECLSFLERVENGELRAFVTDFTLHSLAVVLGRAGKGAVLPQVFTSLAAFQGLILLHASLLEHSDIAILANQWRLDFDDAYQAYFAQRMGVPIVSYDGHFDAVLERRQPNDLLS